jgi:23S rRNA pseudouridine1911/1915/1917 synthase
VIVNKPIGVKVHPSSANEFDTLLNGLYFLLQAQLGEYGVNLVNRIDKETSGLVVAAISPLGAWHYAKQFATTKVNKEYLAVVSSRWDDRFGFEEQKVGNFLNYDSQQRKQSVDKQKGEYALTLFKQESVNKTKRYSLLKVVPKTGRTHQIRVQLAHMHLPILGDYLYEGDAYRRLMLHAHKLELTSPTGESIVVSTPADPEFYSLTSETA